MITRDKNGRCRYACIEGADKKVAAFALKAFLAEKLQQVYGRITGRKCIIFPSRTAFAVSAQ